MTEPAFRWACPVCREPLTSAGPSQMACPEQCARYRRVDGIWRLLTPGKAAYYDRFVQNYDTVRRDEQWGDGSGAYYRALPYQDLTGLHGDIWRVRAVSYDTMVKNIIRPTSRARDRALRILDAGAGNGWLAYRLALEGYDVLAIDLRVDEIDGLGAWVQYGEVARFATAQATFEEIPLVDDELDVVIFSGSLHYTADFACTLREALRVLQAEGKIVIVDSPVYWREESGRQMVVELHRKLERDHGIDASILPHENFLTRQRLDELGAALGLRWQLEEPFYGLSWTLAPWLARLRGRREPARFYVITGERQA